MTFSPAVKMSSFKIFSSVICRWYESTLHTLHTTLRAHSPHTISQWISRGLELGSPCHEPLIASLTSLSYTSV